MRMPSVILSRAGKTCEDDVEYHTKYPLIRIEQGDGIVTAVIVLCHIRLSWWMEGASPTGLEDVQSTLLDGISETGNSVLQLQGTQSCQHQEGLEGDPKLQMGIELCQHLDFSTVRP